MKPLLFLLATLPFFNQKPDWGFFAHRQINYLAVWTLPPDMLVFYKKNADWISEHATDADVRRYAVAGEAPKHFIDLDAFSELPPRRRFDAMCSMTEIFWVNPSGDTLKIDTATAGFRDFFAQNVLPNFFDEKKQLPSDSLAAFLKIEKDSLQAAFFQETMTAHGILPWHLQKMQRDLTEAFRQKNARKILRLSADLGHYLADAHVPLHTCSNYNGQKTGQDGIHAFWESRLPELFAEAEYNFWVGKPDYFDNPTDYFWNVIFESNHLTDSVLQTEKYLRQTWPTDQQICPETRGNQLVLTQCREFSAAYQTAMNKMVERRMRAAIKAIASAWFTAWVEAGQPILDDLETPIMTTGEREEEKMWREKMNAGKILGRPENH